MNKAKLSLVLAICLCILSGITCAHAKIERHFVFDSRPMNLDEIVESADRIFSGTCTYSEEIESDVEAGGLPTVEFTFQITEAIKGVNNNDEITFKQWLPTTRDNGYDCSGDIKYVLFLYPDSKRNLTSSVGVEQGLFEVLKQGFLWKKEVVTNKLNNLGLAKNLSTHKNITFGNDEDLDTYIHHCSEHGKPMRYKEFIKAIKYLVEE